MERESGDNSNSNSNSNNNADVRVKDEGQKISDDVSNYKEKLRKELLQLKLDLRQFCEADLRTSGEGSQAMPVGSDRGDHLDEKEYLRLFDNIYKRVCEEAKNPQNSEQIAQNIKSNTYAKPREAASCRNPRCMNTDIANFTTKEGSKTCKKCGAVASENMMDTGEEKRNFEGNSDRNHHAPAPDLFSPDYANLKTTFGVLDQKDRRMVSLANSLNRDKNEVTRNATNPEARETKEEYKLQQGYEATRKIKQWCSVVHKEYLVDTARLYFIMYRHSRDKLKNLDSVVCCCIAVALDTYSRTVGFAEKNENEIAHVAENPLAKTKAVQQYKFPDAGDPMISIDLESKLNFWGRETMITWLRSNIITHNSKIGQESVIADVDTLLNFIESAVLSKIEADKSNYTSSASSGSSSSNGGSNSSSIGKLVSKSINSSTVFSINNQSKKRKEGALAASGNGDKSFGEVFTDWLVSHEKDDNRYSIMKKIIWRRQNYEVEYYRLNNHANLNDVSMKKSKPDLTKVTSATSSKISNSNLLGNNQSNDSDTTPNSDPSLEPSISGIPSEGGFRIRIAIPTHKHNASISKAAPLQKNDAVINALSCLFK